MAFDREAALAAGYSEEEINEFLKSSPQARRKEPVASEVGDIPDSTTVVPDASGGAAAGAATVGLAAGPAMLSGAAALAPYALGAGAGWYLKNKAGQVVDKGLDIGRSAVEAMRESNAINAARESRMMNRPGFGGPSPVAPTAPAVAPAPAAAPVAPAQPAMPAQAANAARGAATAAQPGNWMAQALNMAKQYAPAMARMGAGLGAATYSGGLNTNEQAELARRRAMEVEQARRQGWIQ